MSSEGDQISPNQLKTDSRSNEDTPTSNDSPSSSSQKQGSQASAPQRSSNRDENPKPISIATGVKNHHSSLEALHEDLKKENNLGPNAIIAPTFGEDDFNLVITDPVLSVLPGKTGNVNKIDMLLEEHKKRKALQNYYEFQNDDDSQDSPSPVSVKAKTPKNAEKPPTGFTSQTEQELLLSPIETKSVAQESISALQSSAIHSFRFENGKQSSPEEQYQFHPSPDTQEGNGVFSPVAGHEETGRFKNTGSARSIEFNDKNISADLKEKYQLSSSKFAKKEKTNSSKNYEKKDYKRADSNISRNTNSTISNLNTSTTKKDDNTYAPKISKNSKKIFQNSQRAKEDEALLQKLMADQIRRLSSGITQEAPEEEEAAPEPEANQSSSSSPKHKFMRLPSGGSPMSEKEQSRLSINFTTEEKKSRALYPKSTFSETSSILKEKETAAQNTSFTPSILSSMRSGSKKGIPAQNNIETPSPRNIKGKTVVEHKRPSRLDNYLSSYRKRTGAASAHISPTAKEIKEIANASKSIYLRMAKKNVIQETVSASPKRKNKNSSPKAARSPQPDVMDSKLVQKVAENAKRPTVNRLGPEEVEKYDEIQRLDIMMHNLRQIQRSNLMSDLYTFRVNNPKPPAEIAYQIKTDWNQYADDINEIASERRWFRRMEVEEKIARMARPPSPRPMEKIDMSVDSLISSTQMRQKMYPGEEERSNMRSWNESGLYDRSLMWLAVRDYKVDVQVQAKSREEMRDCSFKPEIHAKPNTSSFFGSHSRSQTETPISFLNSMSDRFQYGKADNSGLMGGLPTDKSIPRTEKSLYKEKKSLENYSEISDLKKAYNLYRRDNSHGLSNFVVQE